MRELSCFTHDQDSEVMFSCSISWENQLFIFGGSSNKRQISKLIGYHLNVIGSLPFDHNYATCTNMANKKLFLCFNSASSSDYKKCRWTDEPLGNFEEVTSASYNHDRARISSSEGEFYELALLTNFS